ncbi:Kinesin-like protein KIN-7F [Camellia lanceoleosa]|uniref:Kinesin-like protein KIN-7F n=1 Tax=Camellia lanceoleosa TaxID=1840588 RepID=A0ACC0I4K3_9ERIC|nr:Kinesin-like protein KIN-7F [Camellia lanceoleosa]
MEVEAVVVGNDGGGIGEDVGGGESNDESERRCQLRSRRNDDSGGGDGQQRKGRNGHVPFRDSKLTRILQSSLGDNARNAIICSMGPLESELRSQGPTFVVSHYSALLREKGLQIEKLEKEMIDLTVQRDLAQSQVQDLLQLVGDEEHLMTRTEQITDQEFVSPPLKEDSMLSYILHFIAHSYEKPSPWPLTEYMSGSQSLKLTKSRSCKASLMTSSYSPWFEKVENTDNEHTPPNGF